LNITPGDYDVLLLDTSYYGELYSDGGSINGIDVGSGSLDGSSSPLLIENIIIGGGETSVDNNFALLTSSIAGYVYFDTEGDRNFGIGDDGLSNYIVYLSGTNASGDAVFELVFTDPNGYYQFP
jgi:hypothetical protein